MSQMDTKFEVSNPFKQGAEARLYTGTYLGKPCIVKERFSKKYRHPALDQSLTQQRTRAEVRSMMRCRSYGIQTPAVYFVDLTSHKIYMEYFSDCVTLRDHIASTQQQQQQQPADCLRLLSPLAHNIGTTLGLMHEKNIIHGDLTTSNMLLRQHSGKPDEIILIDFGLGYTNSMAEDKGVDLYVLERAFLSTHPNTEQVFEVLLEGYKAGYCHGAAQVLHKLEEVRLRGRKRTMVG